MAPHSRRQLLRVGSLGLASGLAGCTEGLFSSEPEMLKSDDILLDNYHHEPHTVEMVLRQPEPDKILYWNRKEVEAEEFVYFQDLPDQIPADAVLYARLDDNDFEEDNREVVGDYSSTCLNLLCNVEVPFGASDDTPALVIKHRADPDCSQPSDSDDFRMDTETATLAPFDGSQNDNVGNSVSITDDGTTALVGTDGAHAAYVFTTDGYNWGQQARLMPEDGGGYHFGSPVALSSDTALVTNSENDGDDAEVYVFSRTEAAWRQHAVLSQGVESFGKSVALANGGTTALVGAPDQQAAYLYTADGETWTLEATLSPTQAPSDGSFGVASALSGDGQTALVGDADGNAVYVFAAEGKGWTQQARLTPADSRPDEFSEAVALSTDGTTALVGSRQPDDGTDGSSGYVFTQSGGSWTQQTRLRGTDEDADPAQATAVALNDDGSAAIIGAASRRLSLISPGVAYAFRQDREWRQQKVLVADGRTDDDLFGTSVAMADAGTVLVGASKSEDPNGRNSGAAYSFDGSGFES